HISPTNAVRRPEALLLLRVPDQHQVLDLPELLTFRPRPNPYMAIPAMAPGLLPLAKPSVVTTPNTSRDAASSFPSYLLAAVNMLCPLLALNQLLTKICSIYHLVQAAGHLAVNNWVVVLLKPLDLPFSQSSPPSPSTPFPLQLMCLPLSLYLLYPPSTYHPNA
ncbi:hypothetical protein HWV62_22024, partial [Athelia sp. TMB]